MKKIVLNTLMTLLLTSSLAVAKDTINAPNYVEIPRECHCVSMEDYFLTAYNFLNGCNVFTRGAEDKTVMVEPNDTLIGPRLPQNATCLLTDRDLPNYFLFLFPPN